MKYLSSAVVYVALFLFFYSQTTQPHHVKWLILFALSLVCVLVEYFAFLRFQTLSFYKTVWYLILDFIHVFVILGLFFLLCTAIRFKCNPNYLFMLNIFALSTILLFFYFKACFLSLLMYNIINVKNWVNPMDRLKYLFGLDKYNIRPRNGNKIDINTWIRGQTIFFVALLVLNIYVFTNKHKC
jgi:hypothetical protein